MNTQEELAEALRELVRLKDIKESNGSGDPSYAAGKTAAWAKARAALAAADAAKRSERKSFYEDDGVELNSDGHKVVQQANEAITAIYKEWADKGFNTSELVEIFVFSFWHVKTFEDAMRQCE